MKPIRELGIAVIDAAEGTIIGRDDTKLGYTNQCNNVLTQLDALCIFRTCKTIQESSRL